MAAVVVLAIPPVLWLIDLDLAFNSALYFAPDYTKGETGGMWYHAQILRYLEIGYDPKVGSVIYWNYLSVIYTFLTLGILYCFRFFSRKVIENYLKKYTYSQLFWRLPILLVFGVCGFLYITTFMDTEFTPSHTGRLIVGFLGPFYAFTQAIALFAFLIALLFSLGTFIALVWGYFHPSKQR